MIIALTNIDVDCDGAGGGECHNTLSGLTYQLNNIDPDDYIDWVESFGWLAFGDMAYCPHCRKELHD